jgi:hypothetical protein
MVDFADVLHGRIMKDGELPEIAAAINEKRPAFDGTTPTKFDPKRDKSKGFVPESSRAFYLLIGFYGRKLKEAESVMERMEYAALGAAAEERWVIDYEGFFERIKKNLFQSVVITEDWRICVRTHTVG